MDLGGLLEGSRLYGWHLLFLGLCCACQPSFLLVGYASAHSWSDRQWMVAGQTGKEKVAGD